MTRPGDRSQNLRKLTADELAWDEGGWVDESFPNKAVHAELRNELKREHLPDFDAFFGPRLGHYRATQSSADGSPPVAKELRLVDELVEYLTEVRKRLQHLPPNIDMFVTEECWRRNGVFFNEFMRPHHAALDEVFSLLVLAERRLEPQGNKPGAKSQWHRDWLLHDVSAKLLALGVSTKVAAAGAAAAVLRAAGVAAPDDPKEVAALVRKVAKRLEGSK